VRIVGSADERCNIFRESDRIRIPKHQVVRTVPRGVGAPLITSANVPPVKDNPAPGDSIIFKKNTLYIPD
jgi:hydroxybutyrate-dimer hydrolase